MFLNLCYTDQIPSQADLQQFLQPLAACRLAFGLKEKALYAQNLSHTHTQFLLTQGCQWSFPSERAKEEELTATVWVKAKISFPGILLKTFYSETGTNIHTKPTNNV